MANIEHLAILKQGVEVWNKWRDENPNIKPNLCEVNLSGIDLRGAFLRDSDLFQTDLFEANLAGSNMVLANLSRANLFGADLSEAKLNFADLYGANLNNAKISNTDFSFSIVGITSFGAIDLSKAIGLEDVEHESPSTIGIDTLYRSKGNIPEVFLRCCGIPDSMIEYVRSLTAAPIQYYSCFISYSHKDEEFAKRIYNDLQSAGVRCWFAPHDMKIGDKVSSIIDESIRVHDKLLLILSENSVESNWVEHEVDHALKRESIEKKNILFPVRVDDSVMNSNSTWGQYLARNTHIGDFTQWKDHNAYRKALLRLISDLVLHSSKVSREGAL